MTSSARNQSQGTGLGQSKASRKGFYGKYRGMVVENVDPERRGRIRAGVPDVFGDFESGWALPSLPAVSLASGIFTLPGIGASVWIEFEQGDPEFPIWSGGFWQTAAEVPPLAALGPPTQMVLQTALGNALCLDDEQGGASLQTSAGHTIQLNAAGITLMTSSGAMLVIDATGIKMLSGKGGMLTIMGSIVEINGGALRVI